MGITTKIWALDADAIEAQLDDLDEEIAAATVGRREAPGVYLTAATSGSNGIRVPHSALFDVGSNNLTIAVAVRKNDYASGASQYLFLKYQVSGTYWGLNLTAAGALRFIALVSSAQILNVSTVAAIPATDNETVFIVVTVKRESAGVAGEANFYVNGRLVETRPIPAADLATIGNTGNLYVNGGAASRAEGVIFSTTLFNRELTADEVMTLYRGGIGFADKWGSQTAQTSGTLTEGKQYAIDTFAAGDDFANVGAASNASGVEFTATGTTPTAWANGSSLRQIGAVLALEPEGIQPAPGQWLDSSTNKLHAMQPAAGSSLVRSQKTFEFRSTNTWTASSAAQYIGGVNQSVLSTKHLITEIISRATVTTDIEDIEIGDGDDADRFVATVTPTAAPIVHTLANRISDGTHLQLKVTPAAEATMTIEFIVRGIILES